jgi:alpha-tubulin suppressor-like RCC1 family protein
MVSGRTRRSEMTDRLLGPIAMIAVLMGISLALDAGPRSTSAYTYAIVAAGHQHTCAITTAGGAQCWGRNLEGQVGDATTTQRVWPTDVSGLSSGVTTIATGARHNCAVTASSEVRCWGYNRYGSIGDGTSGTNRASPVTVCASGSGGSCPPLTGVIAVGAGEEHTCALTSSGGVKCWG